MPYNILLVDDDATQARLIESILSDKLKYKTKLVTNGQEAIKILTAGEVQKFDLVLLDLSMPGIDGINVINAVKPVNPNLPIIIRTGYDDIDMIVAAMKAGATDFIKKLDGPERLQAIINNALRIHALTDELSRLKRTISGQFNFQDFIGNSQALNKVKELAKKVAPSNITVLLEGESGVGKELLAKIIHANSKRSDKPFIAINCGAIPENQVESTLFGHEKGAFTGATYKTFGKFREANGGTIFLDEIGELKPDVQVKLLRVLQNGEIEPVGSDKNIKVDIRIICATNKNLAELVKEEKFRDDLFYRLNAFPIYIPALRERKEDILKLAEYFIKNFAAAENKNIRDISGKARILLQSYEWPGNIRQLKNLIYRAVVLSGADILKTTDFPQILNSQSTNDQHLHKDTSIQLLLNDNGEMRKLSDIEKLIFITALKMNKCKMTATAKKLGIGRSTLYRKIEEYGIIIRDGEVLENTKKG